MQIEKFKIWKLLYQLNLLSKTIAGCFHYENFQIFDFPSK